MRPRTPQEPFGYSFNTSNIRGQKLTLEEEIQIAADAGFDAIEPWIGEIDQYVARGGTLDDLRMRINDSGLDLAGAIGFFEWCVEDDARRAKGFEEAKRNMEMLATLGGTCVAAPPFGHQNEPGLNLLRAAERFGKLCEVGDQFNVVPLVEFWGFSKSLSRLGEAILVAVESGHPQACVLADVYHMHKGGSPFDGLWNLGPNLIQLFHVNDYPGDIPPAQLEDKHRVYPGDGVAPLATVFRALRDNGYRGYLSLELFNEALYKQDPREVAKTGLAKMRESVVKACAR
ncbi:MAG: sugar phosphate isomerase/epimerase [Planctomycetes bacterium]|nr:sugar phosphate isomerase/epimerase [Planctomycetota bacterium]